MLSCPLPACQYWFSVIEGNMGFWAWVVSGLSTIGKIYETITQRNHALSSGEEVKAKLEMHHSWLREQHKLLWSEMEQNPYLSRILETDVNLKAAPLTTAEKSFLNRVFLYFQDRWILRKTEKIVPISTMISDMRGFFSLPLPHAVWTGTKNFRDRRFVRVVERALRLMK